MVWRRCDPMPFAGDPLPGVLTSLAAGHLEHPRFGYRSEGTAQAGRSSIAPWAGEESTLSSVSLGARDSVGSSSGTGPSLDRRVRPVGLRSDGCPIQRSDPNDHPSPAVPMPAPASTNQLRSRGGRRSALGRPCPRRRRSPQRLQSRAAGPRNGARASGFVSTAAWVAVDRGDTRPVPRAPARPAGALPAMRRRGLPSYGRKV